MCKSSTPLVSFTSFRISSVHSFTCIWVVIFLDLELQKWPDSCISRCSPGRVFFDLDRVIVDLELQVPKMASVNTSCEVVDPIVDMCMF